MTQQRRDKHSTEFGEWTRTQSAIDSRYGYTATNIDWCWENYTTNNWMFLEEKRYGWFPKFYQTEAYMRVDRWCHEDPTYFGFHVLVFEHTNPDDGRIFLDGYLVTKSDLLEFLQFIKPHDWYTSYFTDKKATRQSNWDLLKPRLDYP